MNNKQKACTHPTWVPVQGEFGAYLCTTCEVYGHKLGSRQPKGSAGVAGHVGEIRPWADGKLHAASSWSGTKRRKDIQDRPKDLTNPKLRGAPRPKQLGESFLEPPPERDR